MLGLIVLSAVLVVTIVFAIAAYLIDRGEAAIEQNVVPNIVQNGVQQDEK
jgi:hypothetical protein